MPVDDYRNIRSRAEGGDTGAMCLLAEALVLSGQLDAALTWWRRAGEAGNATAWRAGLRYLESAGRDRDTITWLEEAVRAGNERYLPLLVSKLPFPSSGDSRRWVRHLRELGHRRPGWALAEKLADAGRTAAAVEWFLRVVDGGVAEEPVTDKSIFRLVEWLDLLGRSDEAERWLRLLSGRGSSVAAGELRKRRALREYLEDPSGHGDIDARVLAAISGTRVFAAMSMGELHLYSEEIHRTRRIGHAGPRPPRRYADPDRFLLASMPTTAPRNADINMVARISTKRLNGWPGRHTTLNRLRVGDEGTDVALIVEAQPGLTSTGPTEQVVTVHRTGTPEPVRFTFRTTELGAQKVRLMAWAGGTYLAELELEVEVATEALLVQAAAPAVAALDGVDPRRGQVTLLVRSQDGRYEFQLLSDSRSYEPVPARALTAEPAAAVDRIVASLQRMAEGRSQYSGKAAHRWMKEIGVGLWNDLLPGEIREQFWELRDGMTSLNIASSHNVMLWELLYPVRAGSDDGFLVEQVPMVRTTFGHERPRTVGLRPGAFVRSTRPPSTAESEFDSLAKLLGSGPVVDELEELLALIDKGDRGSFHFVCHNDFSSQDGGSSIRMAGGPLVPPLLNSAVARRSLSSKSPVVFMNTCRSAGAVMEYTTEMGWAQQFMAAGAGAFLGTLWPVRSSTATVFAISFYRRLLAGEPFGNSVFSARNDARTHSHDPTWLAYTAYGNSNAFAS